MQDPKGSDCFHVTILSPVTKPETIYKNIKKLSTQQSEICNVWQPFGERLYYKACTEAAIHNERNKQLIGINLEVTQILELTGKNIKRVL